MTQHSPVMVILPESGDRSFAVQIANAVGYPQPDIVMGGPAQAVPVISGRGAAPSYIVIDIGSRGFDIFPEIDALAEQCEAGTRVVVLGQINDVNFYRELKQRGIIEYFPHPANVADIRSALVSGGSTKSAASGKEGRGKVITFMSAASGDGASTVALNTAFVISHLYKQPTVIVDMDYQFGMIAKNLDLDSSFGIRELFEHPDRGIDRTLLSRMVTSYGEHLKVISAPNELKLFSTIRPEVIRDLVSILQEHYKYVVIDLPHLWSSWVSAALSHADHRVMVAQLWLRSVTHATRLLNAWQDIGIDRKSLTLAINRSGAKFKEAVSSKDFERVCGKTIDFHLSNDIKTVVEAENMGKTILEVGQSGLAQQFREFSATFLPETVRQNMPEVGSEKEIPSAAGILNLFRKK